MLASLGISKRIYGGFAVVLALLFALVALSYVSVSGVSDSFGKYRLTAQESKFLGQISEHFSAARVALLNYRTTGSADDVAAVHHNIDETLRQANGLLDILPPTGEEARAIQGANEKLDEYRGAFEQVVDLGTRFNDVMAHILPVAAEAGERIDTLVEASVGDPLAIAAVIHVQRDFLLARNHTSKFVFANTVSELVAARERLSSALEGVQRMASSRNGPIADAAEATAKPIRDYISDTERFEQIANERNRINGEVLDVVGPEIAAIVAERFDAVSDRQDEIGPQTVADMASTQRTTLIVGAAALITGIALAIVLGRWIAGAVQGMAASMSRMAEGDLDIAVTGDEYKHELGAMARALKVFQNNGREKLRLDAEAKAAAEAQAAAAKERARLQGDVAVVVDRAAEGDFKARVDARYSDESLNAFAGQLNSLVATVAEGIGETVRVMSALAEGNLTVTMQGAFRGAFAQLQKNVNTTIERLSSTVIDIQQVSGEVGTATGEIAAGSENLSSRAENQAASLEEIAATMEEMSATVKTNAENAYSASNLSAEASTRADKGGAIVAEAVTAMASIEEGSRKIADIVTVIDGFAFQTNLLALNAAVEAARAGEAGKGFAVVASEVRTLAQRSADAARDIKALIQESSHQVGDGVRLVEETGTALKEIVEAIRQVSETVTEISEASREQSSGVDEITAAITSMDEITQQNSALADESAAAAKGLTDQASRLTEMVRFFNVRSGAHATAHKPNAWDADAHADAAAAQAASHAEAI